MTFLETKMRLTSRKKANWCKPHRQRLFEQRLEASKQSSLLLLHNSSKSSKTKGKIEIDGTTLAIIRITVEHLLETSPYTVNRRALGSCLVGSRHVLDVHSQARTVEDTLEEAAAAAAAAAATDSNNNINKNKPRGRFGSILSAFKSRSSSNSNNKMDPAVERKYALIHCFHQLEQQSDATRREIHTWDDASEALQTVLILPELETTTTQQQHNELDTNENDILQAHSNNSNTPKSNNKNNKSKDSTAMADFQKRLQDIHLEDATVGLRPSQHLWQEIIAQSSLYRQKEEEAIRLEQQQLEQAEAAAEKARQRDELQKLQQLQEEREKEAAAKERAASLLRELSEEEMERIHDAIHSGEPEDVLAQQDQDTCCRHSLQTLQPGTWLNDEVIHYFLVMLAVRDQQLCQQDPNRKRSHFFKSFFITKLCNEYDAQNPGQYSYKNVKRWSKKVPGKDIFKLDKIFFPINQNNMHWVCAVIFMQQKRIQFYDSMGGRGQRYLRDLFRYLQDEHQDKKGRPLPDPDEWELVSCTPDTPHQLNGFDCGVFTCMFCDFLSKDCPLIFGQEHVDQCRNRIALAILNGQAIM